MRVLLLVHATPLVRDRVVSGNSVRAYYLARGLAESGCDVLHAYPSSIDHAAGVDVVPVKGRGVVHYRTPADLERVMLQWKPDAALVGYWELLDDLPQSFDGPVIADIVAPRILESRFQGQPIDREAPRLVRLYRRADWFLCGTERQRHLLLAWLLVAGFDCRQSVPIDVVPISTRPVTRTNGAPGPDGWCFVTGGVSWPWRQPDRYLAALVRLLDRKAVNGRLLNFGGEYVYNAPGTGSSSPRRLSRNGPSKTAVVMQPLLPYGEMERVFRTQCHVGIDVGERNVEREYSLSFRAIEWLRCGIPVICDDYAELAIAVRAFDAGWTVSSPGELATVVRQLASRASTWRRKSANASRLVKERFHYRRTLRPVLEYLRSPARPAKGTPAFPLS